MGRRSAVADVVVLAVRRLGGRRLALASSLEVVREARTMRDELLACVLITRKQGRTALGKSARKMLESTGLPVLDTELGARVAYQEALAAGQGITTYAARDAGTREIFDLLDELGENVPWARSSGSFVAQAAAR